MLARPLQLIALGLALTSGLGANLGCKPKAVRGGPGTENPNLDQGAMSTTLDRKDLQDLLQVALEKLHASPFWAQVSSFPAPVVVAIWPFKNETSEHIDDQLNTLLGDLETELVNSGVVQVVSRERQAEMASEAAVQQNRSVYDPNFAAQISRQIGAKYFFTGKVGSVDEFFNKERRVQYTLFIQVIEVETSLVRFQYKAERSKAIVR
ncbi:penicillin-binding protein activator LpoB [Nannocystis bainbridge]|uniref:Penicillin-binding protein activator LpoB n=1 Tax=Nannocystis bainbridge TaxID=2995303 RepID=A0ABT5DYG4_9BACT|nr:penicillin-binding protein activator LpoB [Nannocystis bainbridge]MDC0717496.1 penicillin-binding protein activator LpoB [Nannocystis bainbridge]